ncbi:MAG: fatty acyl-AMP ligase [Planctomycetes bacterium]|nr:fatty acyl-AMP ligase [Planctomycetota bacterium]
MTGDSPATILDALAQAAAEGDARGITLLGQREGDRKIGYAELAALARGAGAGLVAAGAKPGDRILVVLPTGEEFLAAFFGAMLAGAIPCPVSPPQGFGSKDTFLRRVGQLAGAVEARAVVTQEDLAEMVAAGIPQGVEILLPSRLASAQDELPAVPADPEATAFLQFTSGTTEVPRGAQLSHRALAANVRQIGEATGIGPESVIVSWLPLYHDMGLIGGVLTALLRGADLVLWSPFGFLRRPRSWLEAIDRFHGTHSPAPTFAFRYTAEKISEEDLEGLDLSSWQVAFVGAEAIHADALAAFHRRLAPCGFAETALLPCYGLAESCLAVTFSPCGRRFSTRAVSRRDLAERGVAEAPRDAADKLVLVSSGRPLPGTAVRVVGEDGADLPDLRLGGILVQGPALFSGYYGLAETGVEGGWLRTGDLGFLDEGDLYVTGRKKDLIIVRGENHHPAEVEWVASGVEGVRAGRVAAFGVVDPGEGTETLCLLAEVDRRSSADPDELSTAIRRRVYEETGLPVAHVELVPPGTLPVTTSGKMQRSRAREIFVERAAAHLPGDTA